jgi:hypothetical protein
MIGELSADRLAELRESEDLRANVSEWTVDELLSHIDALTARIAELEKPVGDADVWAMSSQIARLNSFGERMNADGERASAMLLTLARENAALKVERDAALVEAYALREGVQG